MIYISPSLLAADFTRLGDEVKRIEEAGADYLHLDVMDGVFVPNISFGLPVIESLRKISGLVFDVHLMITNPEKYAERFANAGADIITFHLEACDDPAALIKKIKELGKKASISISPKTSAEALLPYLPELDMVLVMTVEPGFGGQSLIPETLEKVKVITLSRAGWVMRISFPLKRCFRISIQNMGGFSGFSNLFSVNCTLALPDFILIKSRLTKPFLRNKKTSSSLEGWYILST